MWIMWSLNSTIADLAARRQTFKKSSSCRSPRSQPALSNSPHPPVFTSLYRILVVAVIVIGAFFLISSLSFSNRLDQDFGPKTWQSRWVLLDGWLGVLYLAVFLAIAFLWRPTANNRRLALSDELPTDEMEAEEFEQRDLDDGDKGDAIPLNGVGNDSVVFDVGEDDEDEEGASGDEKARVGRGHHGKRGEEQPLRLPGSDDEEEGHGPPPSYHKRSD